jgi:Lrp/AsnC family transcriptional regulator, regulator for asnA, asnC and gidA
MPKNERAFDSSADDMDRRILRVLLEASNLSYRKIAKRLGVSAATIMNRVDRLNNGIVKRYTVMLDYERLGYDFPAAIKIRVMKGRLFEVEKHVARHPNVLAVYDITGDFDSLVITKFRNRRELDGFVKDLQKQEFVERTETDLILNIIKEDCVRI